VDAVNIVLEELGCADHQTLVLLNKIDVAEGDMLAILESRMPDALPISAQTGQALEKLVEHVGRAVRGKSVLTTLHINAASGKLMSELLRLAEVFRSRLFPIRVAIPNPGELAQPGMTVVGMVPVGRKMPRLTIHKDAILRDDAGEFVYFDAGGMAMPARVRTRFSIGDRVVIDDGDGAGDRGGAGSVGVVVGAGLGVVAGASCATRVGVEDGLVARVVFSVHVPGTPGDEVGTDLDGEVAELALDAAGVGAGEVGGT